MYLKSLAAIAMLMISASVVNAQGNALKVGDKAPDFELEALDTKTIKLSDHFGEDGMSTVLLFSRANW